MAPPFVRRAASLVVVALLSSHAASLAADDVSRPAEAAVWAALRAPGTIVVLRHSYAPGGFDPPDARRDDCSTQRNLDERGREQARRIGAAFRAHGIEVGQVLSSPRCRCLDTGRLAFGRADAWDPLEGALNDSERRRALVEMVKRRMTEQHDGAPLVLVTHGSVISDLTGLGVRMGELVVLRRGEGQGHVVVGTLFP